MKIVLSFDSSTTSAPSAFDSAVQTAATYLDNLLINNITVYLDVGWNEVGGTALPSGAIAAGGPAMTTVSYSTVRTDLYKYSTTDAAYQNLPTTDPSNGAGISVAVAQQRAWGLLPANPQHVTSPDGAVGFSSSFTYDFSSTGTVPSGELDFNGIALHELTHALGRVSDFGTSFTTPSVLDLFRYTSAGTLATSASQSAYFSYDRGNTDVISFSTASDLGDWGTTSTPDSFEAYISTGARYPVSALDVTEMNVLGFSTSSCFVTGTCIATPDGETPVEALRPGDPVRLADGGTATVRWIGRQGIAARFADPLRTWPVRIRAGALRQNVPHRDLVLSPGHAVRVGAVLANAAALVNARSILRETRVPERFTYWHVELDTHALLLAEGAPAESFLAADAEFPFDNAAERAPDAGAAEELPYPRCKSARQLPRAERLALAARAALLDDPRTAA